MIGFTASLSASSLMAAGSARTAVAVEIDNVQRWQAEAGYAEKYRAGRVFLAGDAAPPLDDPNQPSGRVGTRAPHLPIEIDGRPASTLDLIGPGFTLLTADNAWLQAAAALELTAHRVSNIGLSEAGAVLIRPDGVIAWRDDTPTDDHTERLRQAMSRLLALQ